MDSMTRDSSPVGQKISRADVQDALAQLNALCIEEYGSDVTLDSVLRDPDWKRGELRLQRLTGIMLKRPFARAAERSQSSATGAMRSWNWVAKEPSSSYAASQELVIINELRLPGPWNERKPSNGTSENETKISWDKFVGDVEHERGLFKVLVLYVDDKLRRKQRRTLSEYTEADESKEFEAGLDLATLVFDAAVTTPLASVLGIPTLVVGTALVGLRFGYRRFIDPHRNRVGDAQS